MDSVILEEKVLNWTFKITKSVDGKLKYITSNISGKIDDVFADKHDVHIKTLVDNSIIKVSNSCGRTVPEILVITYDQIKEGDKILPTQDNDAVVSVIVLSKHLVCEVEASACGVSTLPCDVIYESTAHVIKFEVGFGSVNENCYCSNILCYNKYPSCRP